jgi:regulator of protease activity HflC (stomatin/prohibitin superfamily)
MGEALAWVGWIAEWLGKFIPRWMLLDTREGGVKFQTLLLRDLALGRWDASVKLVPLGPGLHAWWPAVSEIRTTILARQSINLSTQTVTTADGKAVAVGGVIVYRIADVVPLVCHTWTPDTTVRDVTAGAVHDVCSGLSWADLQREKCDGSLMARLQRELASRLEEFGVVVLSATLTDFAPTRVLKIMQTNSSDT